MKFNRADDVSLLKCLRRFVVCLWKRHAFGEWFWTQNGYLHRQRRICARCGWTQERKHLSGGWSDSE